MGIANQFLIHYHKLLFLLRQAIFLCIFEMKFISMESTRQKKVARLIQKELADILLRSTGELAHGKMISVTTVRVSPDLSLAKVYVSIYPSAEAAGVLLNIKNHIPHLRYELGHKVRNQLRIVPELAFFIDDSNDYIENINNLLKE